MATQTTLASTTPILKSTTPTVLRRFSTASSAPKQNIPTKMDARGRPHWYHPVPQVRPPPYTEYIRGQGWMRGARPVRNVVPSYSFIWPRDNAPGTSGPLGRLKDIFTNRGPDIHLSISGDKRTRPFDRPTKSRWSEWTVFDGEDEIMNDNSIEGPAWARRTGAKKYDFRTRKWRRPDEGSWSDVRWVEGDRMGFPVGKWPRGVRDVEGRWLELFPHYPHFPPYLPRMYGR